MVFDSDISGLDHPDLSDLSRIDPRLIDRVIQRTTEAYIAQIGRF